MPLAACAAGRSSMVTVLPDPCRCSDFDTDHGSLKLVSLPLTWCPKCPSMGKFRPHFTEAGLKLMADGKNSSMEDADHDGEPRIWS